MLGHYTSCWQRPEVENVNCIALTTSCGGFTVVHPTLALKGCKADTGLGVVVTPSATPILKGFTGVQDATTVATL